MFKFLILMLFSVSAFSKEKGNEKYLVINLPTDAVSAKKEEEKMQEATLKYILNKKFPLNSDQLKELQENELHQKSVLSSFKTAKKYGSDIVYTDLNPGSEAIPVYLSRGLPLSIILKDTNGKPVDYYDIIYSVKQFSACKPGRCSKGQTQEIVEGAPNNIIVLRANASIGGGILPVYTNRSDFPLSFQVILHDDPGDTYIDRMVVVVNTGEVVEQSSASLKSLDSLTRALNNITPISNAKVIHFDGPIKAWRKGNQMWVRTAYDMKIPSVSNSSSKLSLNGINVYRTRYSSIISVIDNNNGIIRYHKVDANE